MSSYSHREREIIKAYMQEHYTTESLPAIRKGLEAVLERMVSFETIKRYATDMGLRTKYKKAVKRPRKPNVKVITHKIDTLCWSCRNSVPGFDAGCVWSESHATRPVPGWTAEETILRPTFTGGPVQRSYRVIECPEYERG